MFLVHRKICLKFPQMGPEDFFLPDFWAARVLILRIFSFGIFGFPNSQISKSPDLQISRFPDAACAGAGAGAGQTLRSQPDPSPNAPKDQIRRSKGPCCDISEESPLPTHQKKVVRKCRLSIRYKDSGVNLI